MNPHATFSSQSPIANPQRFFKDVRSELNTALRIGWQLFRQNFAGKYRQSFLGYGWTIIPPLAVMITAYLMNNAKVIQYENSSIPYPVFVLCGSLIWQLFSESLQGVINLVQSKRTVLSRILFPRESLIVAQLIESHLTLVILSIPLIGMALFFGISFKATAIFALPLLSSIIVLGTVVGAIIAPLAFLVDDIKRLSIISLSFLFLVTPIVYQTPTGSLLGRVVNLNPLTPLVTASRDLLLNSATAPLGLAPFIISIISLLLLGITWLGFRIAAPIALERVGTL